MRWRRRRIVKRRRRTRPLVAAVAALVLPKYLQAYEYGTLTRMYLRMTRQEPSA